MDAVITIAVIIGGRRPRASTVASSSQLLRIKIFTLRLGVSRGDRPACR